MTQAQRLDDYRNRVLQILDDREAMPSWKLPFHDLAREVSAAAFLAGKSEFEAATIVEDEAWGLFQHWDGQ